MNAATATRLAELRADSASPSEAAAALAADVVTAQDLALPRLAAWLGTNGLGLVLKRAVDNADYPQPLRDGIETLLDQLAWRTGKDEVLATHTNAAVATQFAQVTAGLVGYGIITAPQAAEVLAMAGGYRYERLTAEQITAHWAAEDAATARLQRRQRAGAAYNRLVALIEAGADTDALLTDLEAELDALEA